MNDKLIDFLDKTQFKTVVDDSRKVTPGCLFVAIKGLHFDSHTVLEEVEKNGAVAVVGEEAPENLQFVPKHYFQATNSREALGEIAAYIHNFPSQKLEVIGVTGTDGKTTTSNLIYHILKTAGKKASVVSTISAVVGNKHLDTGFHVTNPEPLQLQKLLDEMVGSGIKMAVLEVTSHGLDQERVSGVKFDTAVLTNITHEHLDYHKTLEKYRDTKLKLFFKAKNVILNADDPSFKYFKLKLANKLLATYSLEGKADFVAKKIFATSQGITFEVTNQGRAFPFKSHLLGKFNVSNLLAGIAAVRVYDIDWETIQRAVASFYSPKGRMEEIKNNLGIRIFVDFAHTPAALSNLLTTAKTLTDGKIICVFGCAGERDATKRPMMADISTSLADTSIFTTEDPRQEKVMDIIKQMEKGVRTQNENKYLIEPDRMEAIKKGINLAKPGDVVLVTGKGHEKTMCFGNKEISWNDSRVIRKLLKNQNN